MSWVGNWLGRWVGGWLGITEGIYTGSADLTGNGSLSATGTLSLVLGSASISGDGTLTVAAVEVFVFGAADLSGLGDLDVHGRVLGGPAPRPFADPGGGGGGAFRTPTGKSGKLNLRLPRVYPHKPELLERPKDLWDLSKTLAVPLPPSQEEERQQQWLAFRERTQASYPEFIAFDWLVRVKKLTPGVDFQFQYSFLGGRTAFGGFVLDFYFPLSHFAWFIQGLHYHYTNPADRGRDRMATQVVASRGVLVVEIFEDDIINRTDYTLEHAYQGQGIRRALS